MPGSAGRWPASQCGGINAVAGQRPALPVHGLPRGSVAGRPPPVPAAADAAGLPRRGRSAGLMPGSAGRWPASLCGGINAVAGQRPALPFGSFQGSVAGRPSPVPAAADAAGLPRSGRSAGLMPGSAGRWPASQCGGINAVAGQRPALPLGSFQGNAAGRPSPVPAAADAAGLPRGGRGAGLMPGSAGRWPASQCGGINAVAGQRPALPLGSFQGSVAAPAPAAADAAGLPRRGRGAGLMPR